MKPHKSFVILGAAFLALGVAFFNPTPTVGQNPVDPNAAVLKLVEQVTAQQAKIIANQTAMEQKLTSPNSKKSFCRATISCAMFEIVC